MTETDERDRKAREEHLAKLYKEWQEFQEKADLKDSLWELCGDFIRSNCISIDEITGNLQQGPTEALITAICSLRGSYRSGLR